MAASFSALLNPLDTDAVAKAVTYLQHLLYVDRPLVPSARERAATANADAVRAVCAAAHRDDTIRLGTTRDTSWLASHELDAGAVTAVIRSTARAHGVHSRHMLSLREMTEEVIADALRSPRLDSEERDRMVAWARQLERRTQSITDLRRRESDDQPTARPTAMLSVLSLLFVTISLSLIAPGSLGALSSGIISPRGVAALGAGLFIALASILRQVLISQWSEDADTP